MMNTAEQIEHNIKKISTTIKRKWMNQILAGTKTSELKKFSKHWNRLIPLVGEYDIGECRIAFLCGERTYRFWVSKVELIQKVLKIDGEDSCPYWEISLYNRSCTQPLAGFCQHRTTYVAWPMLDIHSCRATSECPYEVSNTAGDWCYRGGTLCEHNLVDSPRVKQFVCSGIGIKGLCIRGSKFTIPPSSRRSEQ